MNIDPGLVRRNEAARPGCSAWQADIDADSGNHLAGTFAGAADLDQQTAQLGIVDHQIVGPFQRHRDAISGDSVGRDYPGHQAERAEPLQSAFESVTEREICATDRRRDPASSPTYAATRLVFRGPYATVRKVPVQIAVGRTGALDDFDSHPRRARRLLNLAGVKQTNRPRQTVAAAAHRSHRQAGPA